MVVGEKVKGREIEVPGQLRHPLLPLKLASPSNNVLGVNSLQFCGPLQVCVHEHLVFSTHLPTSVWPLPFSSRKILIGLDMVLFPQVHGTAPVFCFLEAPD